MASIDVVESTSSQQPVPNAQQHHVWEREVDGTHYRISSDISSIDYTFMSDMFASDDVYWCGPLPHETIKLFVENSFSLGLYRLASHRTEANHNIHVTPSSNTSIQTPVQIGFARLITDYATLAYLTDVYLLPECQGRGLGKWLLACIKQFVDGLPALRRAVLATNARGRGVQFYERELGMRLVDPAMDKIGFMEYVPGTKSSEL